MYKFQMILVSFLVIILTAGCGASATTFKPSAADEQNSALRRELEGQRALTEALRQKLEGASRPDCAKVASADERALCYKAENDELKNGKSVSQPTQTNPAGQQSVVAAGGVGGMRGQQGKFVPTSHGPYASLGAEWQLMVDNTTTWFGAIPGGMMPFDGDADRFVQILVQRVDGSVAMTTVIPPHSSVRLVPILGSRQGPNGMPLASGMGNRPIMFELYSSMGATNPAVIVAKTRAFEFEFPYSRPGYRQTMTLDSRNVQAVHQS